MQKTDSVRSVPKLYLIMKCLFSVTILFLSVSLRGQMFVVETAAAGKVSATQ